MPRRLQATVQEVLCLPLRALVHVEGEAATTGDPDEAEAAACAASLVVRHEAAALDGSAAWRPPGYEPIVCRVVRRGGEAQGGGGMPSVLWLDRSWRDLGASGAFVTYGSRLLGFVGSGPPTDGDDRSPAEVLLLHHRPVHGAPRRVAAETQGPSGTLRFVVEPAASIDRWPLRCRLIEDPHSASRLRHGGLPVRTVALADDPFGALPAGMDLGELEVWGYRDRAPIDLFVTASPGPDAVSVVVVWRRRSGPPSRPSLRPPLSLAAPGTAWLRAIATPAPSRTRWILSAPKATLAAGAAVVQGVRLLGTLDVAGRGFALALPFGSTRRAWSLTLLPRDPLLPPVDFTARCSASMKFGEAPVVSIRAREQGLRLVSGTLFTGANGPDCPSGLLIGAFEPGADGEGVVVLARPRGRTVGVYRDPRGGLGE